MRATHFRKDQFDASATDLGGTLTHGLVGPFLGPVVLSVFYELMVGWTHLGTNRPEANDPGSG
jgi:hypothetical protein